MYRLEGFALLVPRPSTTLQFPERQIGIGAFYRWWLWPDPGCPPPISKRIERGEWWSVPFRFVSMSFLFTPLRGQSRSLAIHTCDVIERHPRWLAKWWSGLYTRRGKKNEEVKRDAQETRVSDISSAGKRMNEGKNQDKKLKGKAQQSFHETV